MTFYKFVVDTTTFMLSYSSIQFTLFARLLDEQITINRIHYDGSDTFYVDADLDSFRYLVSNMRGYNINVSLLNEELRAKYLRDVEYFITNKDSNKELQLEKTTKYSPKKSKYTSLSSEGYLLSNNLNNFMEKNVEELYTPTKLDKNIITITKLDIDSDNSFDSDNSVNYDSV